MSRPPRFDLAGAIHHVTARGNHRQQIYLTDIDRGRFLGRLQRTVERYEWRMHAYCLMDNHIHLLVSTPAPTLARGMQYLLSGYARAFNREYSLQGHLFRQHYHSTLVEQQEHFLEAFRYIALNPVRAGLCQRPHAWAWSSYAASVGDVPKPKFLYDKIVLAEFGSVRAIERFVNDGLSRLPQPGRTV